MPKSLGSKKKIAADVTPEQTPFLTNSDDYNQVININLKQMNKHTEELTRLKKNIADLVDVFAKNSSLFSKAAAFWGELPWWLKVITGVVIVVPLLVTSILTHIMVLFAVSLCMFVMYASNSLLLDNHHKNANQDKEKLKLSLMGIASIFESVIDCLDKLREELAAEIEKLHEENDTLEQLRLKLTEEIVVLTSEVNRLSHVSVKLDLTEAQLAQTANRLAESTDEQAALVTRYTAQLEQLTKAAEEQ